jgi:hypothetical protein
MKFLKTKLLLCIILLYSIKYLIILAQAHHFMPGSNQRVKIEWRILALHLLSTGRGIK